MSLKKLIFWIIIFTGLVLVIIFLVQKNNQKKSEEQKSKEDNKKATLYKMTKNNCKLGIYSLEGEILDRDFYRICSNGLVLKVNKETCQLENCPVKDEVNVSDWPFYKNEKYKFSLKYPKNWEVSVVEPEKGLKKLEVLFSNKKCFDQNLISCPENFYGYRIIFYQNSAEQSKIDSENIKYYEKISSEKNQIKLFSGENIFFYVNSEFNELNFRDNLDATLPGAQSIMSKNGYSIYLIGDFRGKFEGLEYFRASIKTLGFE